MIIYLYDSQTGEYKCEYSPQPNPKRKGEFLYPPNSTTLKPENKKGYAAIYDGEKWLYKLDLRGQEIINPDSGEITTIESISEIPDGFVLLKDYIETDDYKLKIYEKEKQLEKEKILTQIDEIDKKRIRAICEPEIRMDGITWLEYYTNQIVTLRERLKEI